MYGALSAAARFRVREALACMQKHHQDPQLCLDSVAKRVGVSRCYLSRILALETGKHFRHHLRAIRMKHAAMLLADPSLAVKEISWAVGYAYVSTFDRDFRAEYNTSPVKFRCAQTVSSS